MVNLTKNKAKLTPLIRWHSVCTKICISILLCSVSVSGYCNTQSNERASSLVSQINAVRPASIKAVVSVVKGFGGDSDDEGKGSDGGVLEVTGEAPSSKAIADYLKLIEGKNIGIVEVKDITPASRDGRRYYHFVFQLVVAPKIPNAAQPAPDTTPKPSVLVRDKNPPEVEVLIGKQFTGKFIPGWKRFRSSMLAELPSNQSMGIEHLERDGLTIFAIELYDRAAQLIKVVDAQVLPKEARIDEKTGLLIRTKENSHLYMFGYCENSNHEMVVGMMRPKPGKDLCAHMTKDVQRAWQIDRQTWHITEIPSEGIFCSWEHPSNCGN